MNTKIALSDKELKLVCSTEWILTKHAVIQKVYDLFGEILPLFEKAIKEKEEYLPEGVFINSPKISKGENYKLLPYVMLDYPRYFGKEDTIAIRTFFWWGNFFSVCLQLSGRFKDANFELLNQKFEWLRQNEYCICVNDNAWEHHFEKDNFINLDLLSEEKFKETLFEKPFIKIAKNTPLHHWQQSPEFLLKTFEELAGLIANN